MACLFFFALLLWHARPDKYPHSKLSVAIRFLHSEYHPAFFYWELAEMLRRLVLVGIFVIVAVLAIVVVLLPLIAAVVVLRKKRHSGAEEEAPSRLAKDDGIEAVAVNLEMVSSVG